jgi:ribose transport system permease protein
LRDLSDACEDRSEESEGSIDRLEQQSPESRLGFADRSRVALLRTTAGAFRRLLLGRLTGLTFGLVAVCTYFTLAEPTFMTWPNWQNIIRAEAVAAILGIGMTFVLLTGGIDLSVASMTAAAGMILGLALEHGWAWPLAFLACVGVGTGMGFVNGFLIGAARIPFFVVTLGTLGIYQSFARLVTPGSQTIALFGTGTFTGLGNLTTGKIGPLPNVLVLLIVLYVLGTVMLRFSKFGYSIFAVGSNARAARLTGVRVNAVLAAVYTASGVLAAIAAAVNTGQSSAATPDADPTLTLTVAAAVLIGGTAFTGGDGGLLGTALGIVFLGVIQNGLLLTNVSAFWQGTVSGLILIIAVGFGVLRDYGLALRQRRIVVARRRVRPRPPAA